MVLLEDILEVFNEDDVGDIIQSMLADSRHYIRGVANRLKDKELSELIWDIIETASRNISTNLRSFIPCECGRDFSLSDLRDRHYCPSCMRSIHIMLKETV